MKPTPQRPKFSHAPGYYVCHHEGCHSTFETLLQKTNHINVRHLGKSALPEDE